MFSYVIEGLEPNRFRIIEFTLIMISMKYRIVTYKIIVKYEYYILQRNLQFNWNLKSK